MAQVFGSRSAASIDSRYKVGSSSSGGRRSLLNIAVLPLWQLLLLMLLVLRAHLDVLQTQRPLQCGILLDLRGIVRSVQQLLNLHLLLHQAFCLSCGKWQIRQEQTCLTTLVVTQLISRFGPSILSGSICTVYEQTTSFGLNSGVRR